MAAVPLTKPTVIELRKRPMSQRPTPAPEGDHRKRPRNRATKSCLNCFKSKRMCDRKRPCSRCTQLGLTGLCVYEVDDPGQRTDAQDDQARLKRRVAELEGVIRELKNKPHPRWIDPNASAPPQFSARSQPGTPGRSRASSKSNLPSAPGSPRPPPIAVAGTSRLTVGTSGVGTYLAPFSLPSPASTSPSLGERTPGLEHPSAPAVGGLPRAGSVNFEQELASLLASSCQGLVDVHDGVLESMPDHFVETVPPHSQSYAQLDVAFHELSHTQSEMQAHCACLTEPSTYHTLLELSLRLRRAADILARSSHHCAGSYCHLLQRIAELDLLTTTTLGNILTPPELASSMSPVAHTGRPMPANLSTRRSLIPTMDESSPVSPHSLRGPVPWSADSPAAMARGSPSHDYFLSWDPRLQQTPTGGPLRRP